MSTHTVTYVGTYVSTYVRDWRCVELRLGVSQFLFGGGEPVDNVLLLRVDETLDKLAVRIRAAT